MLTKNLLRYTLRNRHIHPRFLDTQSRNWQNVAAELALLYQEGRGQSRDALLERAQPIINNARSPLVAKGLNKLLQDRCTFQEPDDKLEPFRMEVFTAAASQLRQEKKPVHVAQAAQPDAESVATNNLEHFRHAVAALFAQDPDTLSHRLYDDLPSRHPLLAFNPLNPEQLLRRYNMAQAQGPLYWADQLTIEMEEPDVGVRRAFFHYLKRCRLQAHITQTRPKRFSIQVDGPLSLLGHHRKYGMLLASFFPAVCALQQWYIHATIRIEPDNPVTLELDQESGLTSHHTHTSTYIPEEVTQFAAQFTHNTKKTGWRIKKTPAMLDVGGREWIAPDFSFRHKSGQVVHLELFHRWHANQLERRLELFFSHPTPPALALGVDRFLTKKTDINRLLQDSAWYQKHGMPFNGFPPVTRVTACLDGFLS